jgi:glycosyltransferase involved in cell wall biosynthesis
MRILFINTTDCKGGAAIVVQRLSKGLEEYFSAETSLLVKTKQGTDPGTHQILNRLPPVIFEKITDRLTRPFGLLYQFFPFSSRKIIEITQSFKPDIINLHNTVGAYFETSLVKKLSHIAPVVWTLHDMWSFTGNSSHAFNNVSWKHLRNDRELTKIPPTIGINTGSFLLRQKKRIYHDSNLTIVTPSIWLTNLARQSPVFEGIYIEQIYNGVDLDVYKPQNKQTAKLKLKIPSDNNTVMFSSHFLTKHNPWKGGTDLIEILRKINAYTRKKISFLVLGEGKIDELHAFENFDIQYMGYVNDESKICDCLNASDLFIYPTRADNLPNSLVEAIACGTPCITFDIGGNKEIIRNNYNGIIIEPFDLESFARNTISLLENKTKLNEFYLNCEIMARKHFQLRAMIERYNTLFQQIIQSR